MENKVQIIDNKLIVTPQGINKLTSMKGKLEFPFTHILGATIDEGILDESKGLKGPGTAIPGYWAGTFTKNGEKTFYNIKRSHKPVVIQLQHEYYTRLILGVENPNQLVDTINNNI